MTGWFTTVETKEILGARGSVADSNSSCSDRGSLLCGEERGAERGAERGGREERGSEGGRERGRGSR